VRAERLLAAFLIAAAPVSAVELGTLFHTAAERERLDALRRGDPPVVQQGPVAAPPRTHPPEVTGYVKRSDGKSTVWIDGRPIATTNSKAGPLLDPRAVRDIEPDSPAHGIKLIPSKKNTER
jgi:hypothetical protein